MNISALIGLWIIIRLDTLIFQKIDRDLFREKFRFSLLSKIVLTGLALVIGFFHDQPWDILPAFLLGVSLPLYIIRRKEFRKSVVHSFAYNLDVKIKSDALGVIISWVLIIYIFELFIGVLVLFAPAFISELEEALLSTVFSSLAILVLISSAAKDFKGRTFNENIQLIRGKGSVLSVFVIPSLIGLLFAWVSAWFVASRPFQPDTPLGDILEKNNSSVAVIIFLILAVIFAPLIEEIIFRGYFYRVIERARGKAAAVLVIALSFGILHMEQYWGDWTAILMVGVLGFVLTFVRWWTGSVVSSAMVHYFYNGGVTVLTAVIIMVSNPPYFDYHLSSALYDFETKERLLKESIFIQPKMAEGYYELAQLYLDERKKTEEALEYIDKALSVNKRSFRFLELKLALLKVAERSIEAEKLANMIKDLYPDRNIDDLSPLKVLK